MCFVGIKIIIKHHFETDFGMEKFYFLLILQTCIFCNFAKRPVIENVMKLHKIECEANPEFVTNVSCRVKVIGREKYVGNMDCYLIKTLNNITATFQVLKFINGYRPFFINIKTNACNILAGKIFSPIVKTLMPLVLRYSNANHTCPYSGHMFVRNAQLTPGIIKSLVPQGRYKGELKIYEGYPNIYVGTMRFIADIDEVRTN